MRAHRRRAGKGNLGDACAGRQGFPRLLAVALHDIDHTGWQQVANHLNEERNGERRLLGRFEHHTVTCSQRRCQLPGSHQKREVPGNDLPDHTERLMEVIRRRMLVDFGRRPLLSPDTTCKVAEMIGRQRHVGIKGFTHGLAVVPGFGNGQFFQILLDAVGNLE